MSFKRVLVLAAFYGTFIMLIFLKCTGAIKINGWWIVAIGLAVPAFVFFYAIYRAIVFRIFVNKNAKSNLKK